jgi:IS5 family transposase
MKRAQTTLASAGFEKYTKTTRRAQFLAEMGRVVPWRALCGRIEPASPQVGNGRPPSPPLARGCSPRRQRPPVTL